MFFGFNFYFYFFVILVGCWIFDVWFWRENYFVVVSEFGLKSMIWCKKIKLLFTFYFKNHSTSEVVLHSSLLIMTGSDCIIFLKAQLAEFEQRCAQSLPCGIVFYFFRKYQIFIKRLVLWMPYYFQYNLKQC